MRLIDADVFVSYLKEAVKGKDTLNVLIMDAVIGMVNVMADNEPVNQWIPCSKRLPYAEYGESDNVLATCGHRDVEDGSFRWLRMLYFNGGNWCYPTGETYLEKVYAWMPLPEPWKGEEG